MVLLGADIEGLFMNMELKAWIAQLESLTKGLCWFIQYKNAIFKVIIMCDSGKDKLFEMMLHNNF